jgi:hypothetical protein
MVYWVNLASPGFFAAAPGATQCTKCPKGEIQVEMVESSSRNGEQSGFNQQKQGFNVIEKYNYSFFLPMLGYLFGGCQK